MAAGEPLKPVSTVILQLANHENTHSGGLSIGDMSGFDEALRRQEAEQRIAQGRQRSEDDQRRRAAEAAIPAIARLLREFAQRLSERGVQPTRVKLTARRGLRPALSSPAGYLTSIRPNNSIGRAVLFVHSLYLVTPDGRLWHWSCDYSSDISSACGGFVEITAKKLLEERLCPTGGYGYVTLGADGQPFLYVSGDPSRTTPLEEELATCALRLINNERSHGR